MGTGRWRVLGGSGLAAGLVALGLAACGGSEREEPEVSEGPEVRETAYGKLLGVDDSTVSGTYFWKGVPFAQPPVGALRWEAPVEPVAWQGVRDAQRFGNACLQLGRIYGPGANNRFDDTIASTLDQPLGSEDCLTLNIWRPANNQDQLPVLLFVHGGSAISGYTADPVYDGAQLAKTANAVVVTANYRLDILGFMQLPQMQANAGGTGNFALLDNLQALNYIQRNIASFGGNAGNVTLMGQSAGAINALALLTADKAKGLFHRIVPISGGLSLPSNLPAGTLPTIKPASAYAGQAGMLLAHLMVDDGLARDVASASAMAAGWSQQQVASYLRGKDAGLLLKTLAAKGLTGSGPIPDDVLIPADPMAALAAGRYNKVPVMAGYTAEEGKLFAPLFAALGGKPGFKIDDAERFRMMQAFDPDASAGQPREEDIIDTSYLPAQAPGTGYNAMASLLGRLFINPSRDQLLNTLRTQQSDVWAYRFDWAQQPAPWNTVYGAAHAFDLPFMFKNFGPSVFAKATNSSANEPGRLALSGAMMASLKAFMHTGSPQSQVLGQTWNPWPSTLIFDAGPSQLRIDQQAATAPQ
ncbi:carboxylesterase/lipase family protein [Comamonas composti]|uniref:carboxylesterase/lipase family protein n=1 Tax=Comamonas composti TaxID=408558 RepID=UPI0003FC4C49|nr:carboxylesterase family protein [Comamonas composti]